MEKYSIQEFNDLNDDDVARLILKYGSNFLIVGDLGVEYYAANRKAALDLINFTTVTSDILLDLLRVDKDGEFLNKINSTLNYFTLHRFLKVSLLNSDHITISTKGIRRLYALVERITQDHGSTNLKFSFMDKVNRLGRIYC